MGTNDPIHLQTRCVVDAVDPDIDGLEISLAPIGDATFQATLAMTLHPGNPAYAGAGLLRPGTIVGLTLEFEPEST